MTATLALPRSVPAPVWFAPLGLPLLPLLAALALEAPFTAPRAICALLLLTIGVVLGLGLPGCLDRLPAAVRKEVGLLRGAYIASLFLVQLPLLGNDSTAGLQTMLFGVTCALLAALPFGAEFQQQTLASLLSQPVTREDAWKLKSGVLAVALGSHTAIFLLSCGAFGQEVPLSRVLPIIALAAAAWGTTPWWTLLTRSLLPGLAFSVATPLVAYLVGTAIARSLGADGPFESRSPDYAESFDQLALMTAPALAAFGAFATRRRWLRLEASESDAVLTPRRGWAFLGSADRTQYTRSAGAWLLFTKELRLQTVSLTLLGFSAALFALAASLESSPDLRELVLSAFSLTGVTTAILAGATPIAEESRLGTLDQQLLLPVRRNAQWWGKFSLGALVAAAVTAMMLSVFWPTSVATPDTRWPVILQIGALCLGGYSFALLTSSGSPNALRAVITTFGILAAIAIFAGTALVVGADLAAKADRASYVSALTDVARWKAEAATLDTTAAKALYTRAAQADWDRHPIVPLLAVLGGLPPLLALVLSRRNFLRPADATRRLPRQITACLGLVGLLCGAWTVATAWIARANAHDYTLANIKGFVDLEANFSPADRELWNAFRRDPYSACVTIPVRSRPGQDSTAVPLGFQLPLNTRARRVLMHHGQIDAHLRELLREESVRKGEDLTPPVPEPERPALAPDATEPSGTRRGPLPPGLRARYGLAPRPPAAPSPTATNQPRP